MSEIVATSSRAGQGWQGRLIGEDDPIGLPLNSTSQALENFRTVKSGAGSCFGLSGFSNRASAQFVHIYDASALPADGAIPVFILNVGPSANFSVDFGYWGRAFSHGIIVGNSTTAVTKTIGAADCFFDVQFV